MSSLWSKFGVAIIALLAFLALVPALQSGLAVFRRLLKGRARGPSRAAGVSLSRHFRFIVLLVFTVGLIYHGSTKSNGRMAVQRLRAEAPVVQTNDVAAAWSAAERAPGYVLAATGTTVATDFAAPATALHLARWVPGGRSDDFMAVPCPFTNLIVGINGTLTTAPYGIDEYSFVPTNSLVVAPVFATNGLIPCVSEFWFTTNAAAARYVWRNVAYERSASNLVSFAATYCRNRDLVFEYGPAFPSNALSLIQNGTNILVLAALEEMQLRFNQGSTHVPPFSISFCGAVAEPLEFLGVNFFPSNRSYRFAFIADLGDGTADLDADGVSNYNEVMLYGTDPRSADTDQDNLADGAELAAGTDPRSFDTDADGLADSVDANPTNSNGNCYGQGTNWVAATYGTNAAAIIAQGYENYVSSTVTNDVNGWWYSFTVTVSNFDDSGHAFVRVGDQAVVLARPESGSAAAAFLLKRGKKYEIHVIPDQTPGWETSPSNDSCPSVTRSNGFGSVIWPPALDLTPADCHFGTITHTWRQIFTATIRDCHPDLVSARIWSSACGHVSIAASPNGPATVSWTNIVEGTLTDTLYCDALIDGYLWRRAASLFYETPEGALPHVELAAADTIFCNDDDDNANGTNDYADASFTTGEDDDLIPVTVSFKSDIPTNADLRLSIPSGGLRLWRTRNHAEELTPPLLWENVSAPTSIIVYAERDNITSDQPDDIVVQAEWLVDDQSIARTRRALTAIEPDMRPITTLEDDRGSICNPALVATGENATFHVDVWPDDYPSPKIVWSSSSDAISFLNGTTGSTVVVRADHQGLATLSVTFGDCPSPKPQVTTEVIDESIVKIQPWIVGPKGRPAHTTPEIASNFVSSANRLFRQAAMRFILDDFHYLTNSAYAVLTLDGNGRCVDGEKMLDTTNGTQEIEVYFVDAINGFADGFANADGVIVSIESTSKAFAHELGHACGLRDIFDARNGVSVVGLPSRGFEPEDWNNGTGCRYYPRAVLQSELIEQLLMYWKLTSSPFGDLPRGTVEGIWYEWRSNTVTQAWEQLQHPQSPVAVGCSSINRHPASE